MEKMKQRAVYFTDAEWEAIKLAAKSKGKRSTTHYVSETLNKQAARDNK